MTSALSLVGVSLGSLCFVGLALLYHAVWRRKNTHPIKGRSNTDNPFDLVTTVVLGILTLFEILMLSLESPSCAATTTLDSARLPFLLVLFITRAWTLYFILGMANEHAGFDNPFRLASDPTWYKRHSLFIKPKFVYSFAMGVAMVLWALAVTDDIVNECREGRANLARIIGTVVLTAAAFVLVLNLWGRLNPFGMNMEVMMIAGTALVLPAVNSALRAISDDDIRHAVLHTVFIVEYAILALVTMALPLHQSYAVEAVLQLWNERVHETQDRDEENSAALDNERVFSLMTLLANSYLLGQFLELLEAELMLPTFYFWRDSRQLLKHIETAKVTLQSETRQSHVSMSRDLSNEVNHIMSTFVSDESTFMNARIRPSDHRLLVASLRKFQRSSLWKIRNLNAAMSMAAGPKLREGQEHVDAAAASSNQINENIEVLTHLYTAFDIVSTHVFMELENDEFARFCTSGDATHQSNLRREFKHTDPKRRQQLIEHPDLLGNRDALSACQLSTDVAMVQQRGL